MQVRQGHPFFQGVAGGEWAGFGPFPVSPIPRLGAICTSAGVGLEWGLPRGRSRYPPGVGVGDSRNISRATCVVFKAASPEDILPVDVYESPPFVGPVCTVANPC